MKSVDDYWNELGSFSHKDSFFLLYTKIIADIEVKIDEVIKSIYASGDLSSQVLSKRVGASVELKSLAGLKQWVEECF